MNKLTPFFDKTIDEKYPEIRKKVDIRKCSEIVFIAEKNQLLPISAPCSASPNSMQKQRNASR